MSIAGGELVTRPELKKDTKYSKRFFYVRKDLYLPTQVDYFDKRGRLLNTVTKGFLTFIF